MRKYIRHPADIPIEYHIVDDSEIHMESLQNVSRGGLAFLSSRELKKNLIIEIRIDLIEPPFVTKGKVVWCRPSERQYEVGIALVDAGAGYATRMVEQICHIEHYRQSVRVAEGRELSGREAALEWIAKYAGNFPATDEIFFPEKPDKVP